VRTQTHSIAKAYINCGQTFLSLRNYPSQIVTQGKEMETGDRIEEPSLDAGVATEHLLKTSSSIGTQGSAATSINEENVTTSVQSSSQSEVMPGKILDIMPCHTFDY
jgi:hypothetical protein